MGRDEQKEGRGRERKIRENAWEGESRVNLTSRGFSHKLSEKKFSNEFKATAV